MRGRRLSGRFGLRHLGRRWRGGGRGGRACASVRLWGAGRCPMARGGLGQPVAASGPVAFERPMVVTSLGGDRFGPALCSDAVWSRVPVAPGFGGTGAEAESLILAQNERWRRA